MYERLRATDAMQQKQWLVAAASAVTAAFAAHSLGIFMPTRWRTGRIRACPVEYS
jgi:hypothetical protein